MQYKYIALVNTTLGAFMALLDSNIVLISLPTIIRELSGTSPLDGIWVIMGYSLITATLLLTFGRLSDLKGRVRLYKAGFAIFTIGSALCSISLNGTFLVLARLVQGTGGALIIANGPAILTDAFPVTERGRALGINQVAGVSGSVSGLVLGGILTSALGWRSIFWVNIPVGIFATLWAHYRLRELAKVPAGERIDPAGNALFAIGLVSMLLGLTFGAITGWRTIDISLSLAGVVMLMLFLFVENKVRSPMIDLRLFRIKTFAAGVLSNFLSSIARGAILLLLVFYFQGALLLDPLTAGIRVLPFSVAFVVSGPICGHLSDKYGARIFTMSGMIISTIAYAWFSTLQASTPYSTMIIPMLLAGAGGGMFVAPNTSSIMSSVPPTRRGVAAGTSSTLFNTGYLLSLSLAFVLLARAIPLNVLDAIFAGIKVSQGELDVNLFMQAMHQVFLIAAGMSIIAAVTSILRDERTKINRAEMGS
ncbi:MAG: MFS transporter [Conexivisphaerales archaeon]